MGTLYYGDNLEILRRYPKLQLRTVRELMDGQGIEQTSNVAALDETFKKAAESTKKHMPIRFVAKSN